MSKWTITAGRVLCENDTPVAVLDRTPLAGATYAKTPVQQDELAQLIARLLNQHEQYDVHRLYRVLHDGLTGTLLAALNVADRSKHYLTMTDELGTHLVVTDALVDELARNVAMYVDTLLTDPDGLLKSVVLSWKPKTVEGK